MPPRNIFLNVTEDEAAGFEPKDGFFFFLDTV
jgi:hypothetical protein